MDTEKKKNVYVRIEINQTIMNCLMSSRKLKQIRFYLSQFFFLRLINFQVFWSQRMIEDEHMVNENHFDNCYIPFLNRSLYPRKQAMDDLSLKNKRLCISIFKFLRLKRIAEKTIPKARPDPEITKVRIKIYS